MIYVVGGCNYKIKFTEDKEIHFLWYANELGIITALDLRWGFFWSYFGNEVTELHCGI